MGATQSHIHGNTPCQWSPTHQPPPPSSAPPRPAAVPAAQLIDGQQRLTTLVILLSFLHSTAKEQQNEVLEQRIKRMLYLEADPLDPNSTGR